MARIQVSCGQHEDYSCCGCDEVVLTGQDAIDQAREDEIEDIEFCFGDGFDDGEGINHISDDEADDDMYALASIGDLGDDYDEVD